MATNLATDGLFGYGFSDFRNLIMHLWGLMSGYLSRIEKNTENHHVEIIQLRQYVQDLGQQIQVLVRGISSSGSRAGDAMEWDSNPNLHSDDRDKHSAFRSALPGTGACATPYHVNLG